MLSRRGLFGFLAAAPVVAPAIAKELAQPLHVGGVAKIDGPLPLFGEIPSKSSGIIRTRDGSAVFDLENAVLTFNIPGEEGRQIFSTDKCYLAKFDDFDGVGCA